MAKHKTKEIKLRFTAIADLGCIICGQPPQIHHCIGHAFGSGKGMKSKDDQTFGLCHNHHVGREGIHIIGRKTWEAKFGTQQHYLDLTNVMLNNMPEVIGR